MEKKINVALFACEKRRGGFLRRGGWNNSKMRLAAFLNYEPLLALSGVLLVRFLPTRAENEHPRLFYFNTKYAYVLYSIFLPSAARKWRKEKPFKGARVCVLDRLR